MVKKAQDGFSDWTEGGIKKVADLSARTGIWPSASDVQGMVKTGSADVARTSLQFMDPAYLT